MQELVVVVVVEVEVTSLCYHLVWLLLLRLLPPPRRLQQDPCKACKICMASCPSTGLEQRLVVPMHLSLQQQVQVQVVLVVVAAGCSIP
jgi:ferredoxin